MKYMTLETQRFVVYYEQDGKVLREVFFTKEDAYSKYKDIIELEPTNTKIIELRTRLLEKQLDNNFLSNLSSPLEDDKVCFAIMEKLFTNKNYANSFRMKEDSKSIYKEVSVQVKEKMMFDLLKYLLNNYELIAKDSTLRLECMQKIYAQKDNDDKLLEYVKKYLELSKTGIFNNQEEQNLLVFFRKYIDFNEEHVGNFKNEKYEARIYLNCHNEDILYQFMNEYAKECIKNNIDYDCKGLFNSVDINAADTTILYSQNKDIKAKIIIIENIMNKHPEWREVFNAPVYSGLTIGTGFYSLTHKGTHASTYSGYYQQSLKIVRASLLAKIIIENNLISKLDVNYEKIKKLLELNIINNKSDRIASMSIDGMSLANLCEIIEPYLKDPKIQEELLKTTPDTFRSYLNKIHSIYQGFDSKLEIPLGVDKEMYNYFGFNKEKKNSTEEVIYKEPVKIDKPIYPNSSPVQDDISMVITSISKKINRYILTGKSIEEKRMMMSFNQIFKSYIEKKNYDSKLLLKIQEEFNKFGQYGFNSTIINFLEQKMTEPKQKSDDNDLKENVEKLNKKLNDYNNDGYVSIEEFIKGISDKCLKYITNGDSKIQSIAVSIRRKLNESIKNNKYDIELIAQLDEALNEYENNKESEESIENLYSLNQRLIDNPNDKCVSKSKTMFKDASIQLFFKQHLNYKKNIASLMEMGLAKGEPEELAEYRLILLKSFSKVKAVKDESFDMSKYVLFREIVAMVNQEINKKINELKKGQFNKIEEDKKYL